MDVVAFFSRVEELRAQKPAISKPGRGRRRSVTLGSSTPDQNAEGVRNFV